MRVKIMDESTIRPSKLDVINSHNKRMQEQIAKERRSKHKPLFGVLVIRGHNNAR